MANSPPFLFYIFAFLLLLGPLIVIHELGHYLAGRWCGVRAEKFSIGFGKELWHRIDKRGTRWRIAAMPLGGYVQFAGDADASSRPDAALEGKSAAELKGTMLGAPLWQRALIVLAGPLANLLAAVVIFTSFNLVSGRPANEPVVVDFLEQSDAQSAGIERGDRILAVAGRGVSTIDQVDQIASEHAGLTIPVELDRSGRKLEIPVSLASHLVRDRFGNEYRIGKLGIDFASPQVMRVGDATGAEAAGVKPGDRLISIDGEKVDGFADIRRLVEGRPGQTVSVLFDRGGKEQTVAVKLGKADIFDEQGKPKQIGLLGIAAGKVVSVGPFEAVTLAIGQCADVMRSMAGGLKQILFGERSVREMGGLPRIAKFSGEMLSLGWQSFVGFAALISINLAFINLLPIPTLDGGHLAIYAAEAVRRRPLGLRSQELAFRIGMALVLAFAVFVNLNDLVQMFL